MFRRKVRIKSKRSLKPFQRDYKDVGSVVKVSDIVLLIIFLGLFSFIVYGIVNAIRM